MPDDYRWSSYRDYIGLREVPTWLNTALILGCFGTSKAITPKKYRKFVEELIGKEQENPLMRVGWRDVACYLAIGEFRGVRRVKRNRLGQGQIFNVRGRWSVIGR